jgi:Na+-transporting methylmalonyl-CoA/oxaloacetate decarboxylase gamma subunit
MFKDMGGAIMKDAAAGVRVEGFWRLLGVGNVFVFLGALMAELGFLGGIVGGAKKNKAETKAKMQASAERKRK